MRHAVLIAFGLILATAAFSLQGEPAGGDPASLASDGAVSLLTAGVMVDPGADPVAPATEAPRAIRIALQAGHWKAAEAPEELARIRSNGTRGGGKMEWEVNLEIAELSAAMLREFGYEVDILPATVPPQYQADLFISIHADGHDNPAVSGYRVAPPRRDRDGASGEFSRLLLETYGQATGLRGIPDVTRRMENYYAFNFRRYQHSLHPETTAVILETGFLTSPSDRRVIVDDQTRSARGIVEAVNRYFGIPVMGPDVTPLALGVDE